MGRRVLVTGAGGFIGSHLVERLVRLGAITRAFVRYNSVNARGWLDESDVAEHVEVFFGDVRDLDSLEPAMRGVEVVFHLAALIAIPYSYDAPLSYVRTNVEGTVNVLRAAGKLDVGLVVQTSTSEVYGTARYVPIDEAHPLQAQSPYSASKIAADKLCEAYHRSYGLPLVTVRPFNTFGPRQSARAVVPTIIVQALNGKTIELGSLEPTRDFNYVEATVEGFVRLASAPRAIGEVVNVGSGNEISIGDLTRRIQNQIGSDLPVICDNRRLRPVESEVSRLCADIQKLRELTEWEATWSLDDGLRQTIDWMAQNLNRYRPREYTV